MSFVKWSGFSLWNTWIADDKFPPVMRFIRYSILLLLLSADVFAVEITIRRPGSYGISVSSLPPEPAFTRIAALQGIDFHQMDRRTIREKDSTPGSILLNEAFIEDARHAIDLLYNRDYDASLDKLADWKARYPDHPVWSLWPALEAWWPVLVDLENTSYDDAFLKASKEVIDVCDEKLEEDENSLDALVVRSIMYGQISRYYSNRFRWYRSFRNARRALRDFYRIEESHPDIPDLNFGIGMYRYFSSFLVEEYTLARPLQWMLPSGSRQEGLSLLGEAADSSIFLEPEATFFLGHINLHFEKKPARALGHLRQLYHRYPDNTYYRRLYIRSLSQLNRREEAIVAINETLDHFKNPEPGTESRRHEIKVMREDLYTIRGYIHYQRSRYNAAETDFKMALNEAESLKPFAERANLLVSLYYLGELMIRSDRRETARFYFSRAATPDTDNTYSEKSRRAIKKYHLE